MGSKWLSSSEFRNIKDIKIDKHYDGDNVEYREIELIDVNDDVHKILVRMDAKSQEEVRK